MEKSPNRPTLTISNKLVSAALNAAGEKPGSNTWFASQAWGDKILRDRDEWSIKNTIRKHQERRASDQQLRGVFS